MILISSMRTGFHAMRFTLFALLFITFSLVFVVTCDDPLDFGGINVLHDAMRQHLGDNLARTRIVRDSVQAIAVPTTTAVPDPLEPFANHPRDPTTRNLEEEKRVTEQNQSARRKVVQSVATQATHGYVKYSWTRWLDMLYFSISNTITMGYGDIFPISPKAKLLVMTQILCTFAVLCVEL